MERSATVDRPRVLVTFAPAPELAGPVGDVLDRVATVTYLDDVTEDQRPEALTAADAVFGWFLPAELHGPEEFELLGSVGLVQLLSARVDQLPLERIPDRVPVASNAGAYADPMAEHVLGLTLALAKRLPQNHAAMADGRFDQHTPTRSVRGAVA